MTSRLGKPNLHLVLELLPDRLPLLLRHVGGLGVAAAAAHLTWQRDRDRESE